MFVMTITFPDWINKMFVDWQAKQGSRKTIQDFANFVGVSRPLMNMWMNGNQKPGKGNIEMLANIFGNEVYDVLEIPRPKESYDRRVEEIDQKTKTAMEESTAAEIRNAKRNQVMTLLLSQLSQQAQHLPHWLNTANPSEVNTVLHSLFEKIILRKDTIELVFWE